MRHLARLIAVAGVSFGICGCGRASVVAEQAAADRAVAERVALDRAAVERAVARQAELEPASAERPSTESNLEAEDEPVQAILSGKVVLLSEAFKQRDIKAYDEEIKGQVVLVTRDGELVPIAPDWRGRAFYQDERLRDRPVDLTVHRRRGVPWVQVLSIYLFDEGGVRNIFDYWCDVCAIPMFEIRECECCQGPIRIRLRPQELPRDAK
jgi:hypothetical protein